MRIVEATEATIREAADALLAGQLVIIPTETVYGLAADATNVEAVQKVFAAKERPAENPLIVHVSELGQLFGLASEVSRSAATLAQRFWPGPLTLVLPKHPSVPDEVTGGLDTVAVRMPSHPVALDLIRLVGRPLAAPSANRFMRLSPTRADSVDPELAEKAAMVLDGGPSRLGLESTVIDCTGSQPRILRPGGVTRAQIQAAIGPLDAPPPSGPRRSPGMYARHYAPTKPVMLVDALQAEQTGLTLGESTGAHQIRMPAEAGPYSANLYEALHRLDRTEADTIYIQRPPDSPEWEAVHDRLTKASAQEP